VEGNKRSRYKKLRNKNELRRETFATEKANAVSLSLSHREQTGQFKLCSLQSEVSGEAHEQRIHPFHTHSKCKHVSAAVKSFSAYSMYFLCVCVRERETRERGQIRIRTTNPFAICNLLFCGIFGKGLTL
jgi:hypothetical protein